MPSENETEVVVPRVVAATGHAIRARWDVDGAGASLAAGAGSAQGSGMRRVADEAVLPPALTMNDNDRTD